MIWRVCPTACCPLDSFAVELNTLFPSVENGLVVLVPLSHEAVISIMAGLRSDDFSAHLLIIWIHSKAKSILVGQPV